MHRSAHASHLYTLLATCTLHKYNIMYLIIIAPLSMYKGRRSRSFEEDFPHHNWFIVVLVLPFVSNTGYLMLTPSIYQFVTTPRSLPEELENTEVCGLSTVKNFHSSSI